MPPFQLASSQVAFFEPGQLADDLTITNLSVQLFTLAAGTLLGCAQVVAVTENYMGAIGASQASTLLLPTVPSVLCQDQ